MSEQPRTTADPELEAMLARIQAAAAKRQEEHPCTGKTAVQVAQEELRERLARGRVPRVHHALLENTASLQETDCLRLVRVFHQHDTCMVNLVESFISFTGKEQVLILSGGPGCGKSLAACYPIAMTGGLFVSAPDLARLDSDTADDGEQIGDLLRRARTAKLLVLDDLGTEHEGATSWATGRIADLLCTRHERCLTTICTTNLQRRGEGGVAARYGARLDDRLRSTGIFVGIDGPSLRGRSLGQTP